MAVVIDGTNGITTPLDVEIQGATSGSIIIAAPAVAGSNTQTLVAATGTLAPLIAGTAVASTSGTSIDFTGIPSWAKRITVMFSGVSTNGTSNPLIQIGSTTFTTSGYLGSGSALGGSVSTTAYTTGFGIVSGNAANALSGALRLNLLTGNTWVIEGVLNTPNQPQTNTTAGFLALANVLDRVRITTVNGTDTFDAGTINILYE